MSEPNKPYEVEPTPGGTPPEASKARPIDFPPAKPAEPKGKIEAPELLAGFEKDADFDKDPEVDRVILGKAVEPAKPAAAPPPGAEAEEFVQEGLGGAKVWAIVGGVLLVAAMIAAGMQPAGTAGQRVLRVLLVLYNTLLHTGTGVVAVFVAARLLGKHLGNFELAAARMFAAVGAFALLVAMHFQLTGRPWFDNLVVLALGSGAYVLLVATLFNVWQRTTLLYIVGSHFFLWLIVAIGMLLSIAAKEMPTTSPPRPAPAVQTPAPKATGPTGATGMTGATGSTGGSGGSGSQSR